MAADARRKRILSVNNLSLLTLRKDGKNRGRHEGQANAVLQCGVREEVLASPTLGVKVEFYKSDRMAGGSTGKKDRLMDVFGGEEK